MKLTDENIVATIDRYIENYHELSREERIEIARAITQYTASQSITIAK